MPKHSCALQLFLFFNLTLFAYSSEDSKIVEPPTKIIIPTQDKILSSQKVIDRVLEKDIQAFGLNKISSDELAEKCESLIDDAEESATVFLLLSYASKYYAIGINYDKVDECLEKINSTFEGVDINSERLKIFKLTSGKINAKNAQDFLIVLIKNLEKCLQSGDVKGATEITDIIKRKRALFSKCDSYKEYLELVQQFNIQKKAYSKLTEYEQLLAKKPNDPVLNFQYGINILLLTRNWDKALPHIARGNNKEFVKIAETELKKPIDENQIIAIGDFYWDLADARKNSLSNIYKARAVFYYTQIVGNLKGLRKIDIQQRIDDAGNIEENIVQKKVLTKGNSLKIPSIFKYKIKDEVDLELVRVEPGSFMMGSLSDEKKRKEGEQEHNVTITKDFWIAVTETSEIQWNILMNENAKNVDPSLPVQHMSWTSAMEYCDKLTRVARLAKKIPDDYEFRLPTEAEWEYAARGGKKSKKYIYPGSNDPEFVGPVDLTSAGLFNVRSPNPNEIGLYMMGSGVWEWCYDWHDEYDLKQTKDPIGPETGIYKIIRGGRSYNERVRSATRGKCRSVEGDRGDWNVGFRVVLAPKIFRSRTYTWEVSSNKNLPLDISESINSKGKYKCTFLSTYRTSNVTIERVQLFQEKKLISDDKHIGYIDDSENTKNNTYILQVGRYNPKEKYLLNTCLKDNPRLLKGSVKIEKVK